MRDRRIVLWNGEVLLALDTGWSGGSVLTGTIVMGATAGKVALVNSTAALTGSGCPFGASVVDFVGYGTANCFEGTGAAPAPPGAGKQTDIRNGGGCTDSDNNSTDFALST